MKYPHKIHLPAKLSSQVLIGFVSMVIIIVIGILFPDPKIPFHSFTKIFGFILILGGLLFHGLSHKVHKQAHQDTEKIEKLGAINKVKISNKYLRK